MAASQDQWFEKLKSWVPAWFFEKSGVNIAVFKAFAKILAEAEAEQEELVKQTRIDYAVGAVLGLHGWERSTDRVTNEMDPSYRVRVRQKSLVSNCGKPALKSIIDALVIAGSAQIREDYEGAIFYNRRHFYNRGEIVVDPIENAFTVVVDRQVHSPYSFYSRNHFYNRESYMGMSESSRQVFLQILQAVNENKAFGTLYRIIERFQ